MLILYSWNRKDNLDMKTTANARTPATLNNTINTRRMWYFMSVFCMWCTLCFALNLLLRNWVLWRSVVWDWFFSNMHNILLMGVIRFGRVKKESKVVQNSPNSCFRIKCWKKKITPSAEVCESFFQLIAQTTFHAQIIFGHKSLNS